MKQVLVIGAGAAGMLAAITAAANGASVTLLEKNEKTGKKLYITGKGRCNVTNGCDRDTFFENIVSNGKFLYSAYSAFDNGSIVSLLEQAGCPLKEERGARIFPVSDHSSDVITALNRLLKEKHVKLLKHSEVKELVFAEEMQPRQEIFYVDNSNGQDATGEQDNGGKASSDMLTDKERTGTRRVCGVRLTDGTLLTSDAVIVATGGQSYEPTGSTGDGYRFARAAAHTVKEVKPALVPFTVREEWCKELQGLSLKNVACILKKDKKKIYEGFGEMLFTHFGVSGPLILSASSYYVKKYHGEPVQLVIDLKPALSKEQLDQRLLRDFEKYKNKQFKNALDELLPSKLIPVMIGLSGIPDEKRVNEITKAQRMTLVGLFKELTLTVTGTRGFTEAIITQGGVSVKEINPSTMESKLVSGLYFAGEVLDVDALTGGFNLQIAWSTGYAAGLHAAGAPL